MNMIYKALTIAGSDTSGGAGMEADMKTFQEMDVYGLTALTVIVAQNPRAEWAHEIYPIELDVVEKQLVTVCEGIGVDAVKTGMLGSAELVELVARTIDRYELRNVVIDPVMVCKGVDSIMVPDAAEAIKSILVKRADVLTPNILEAAYLTGMEQITTAEEMREAAGRLVELGAKAVVIKAGERIKFGSEKIAGKNASGRINDARCCKPETAKFTTSDIAYDGKTFREYRHTVIDGAYNHGAGCTFSAGITACLARGMELHQSLDATEDFVHSALENSFRLNKWSGALRHSALRKATQR